VILYRVYYEEDLWKGYKQREIEQRIYKDKLPKIEYKKTFPKEITDIIKEALVFEGKMRITVSEISRRFEEISS